VVEVLKQAQYEPVPVAEQVLVIYAVTNGFMDGVAADDVARFELGLREWMRSRHPDLLTQIADTGEMPEAKAFRAAIDAYRESTEEG